MPSTKSPNLEVSSERTSSITEREIKGLGYVLSVCLVKPLYEVCLRRIRKQVGENRSTVCTHSYADYLLKNTSIKHNKYAVKQKLEHIDDINFREVFGRIRVFLFLNKICPVPRQGICIYSFLRNTFGLILLICLEALSGNNCVESNKCT